MKGACESDMDQQSLHGNGDQRLKRAHGAAHAEREREERERNSSSFAFVECGRKKGGAGT